MASSFVLSKRALDDLDQIHNYISAYNLSAADRVQKTILDCCKALVLNPYRGAKRSEIASAHFRFWTVTRYPNFVIAYRPDTDPLVVVAVIHSKRDPRKIALQ